MVFSLKTKTATTTTTTTTTTTMTTTELMKRMWLMLLLMLLRLVSLPVQLVALGGKLRHPNPLERNKTLSTKAFQLVTNVASWFVPTRGVPRLVRQTALDPVQNLCYELEKIREDEKVVRKLLTQLLRLWSPDIKIRTPKEVSAELKEEQREFPW